MLRNGEQRNGKYLILIVVLSIFLLYPAIEAFASKAEDGEGSGFKRGYFRDKYGQENMKGKETQDLIDTFRLVRMVQMLELDQEQAAQIGVISKERTAMHREMFQTKRNLGQELRDLLKDENVNESELKKVIDRANKMRREYFEKEEALEGRIQALMSTEQRARYLLFNESFHRDILKNLRQVRENMGDTRELNPPSSPEQDYTEQDMPHDPPPPGPMGHPPGPQ